MRFKTWSERRDSDPRPRPWQGRALPTELLSQIDVQRTGAKDGTRTRDPDLGKVVLYQLSYFRVSNHFLIAGTKVDVFFELAKYFATFFQLFFQVYKVEELLL